MRILLVSHGFPPLHAAGTELYALRVGQGLAQRGHDVHVFTATKEVSLQNLTVRERTYEGLPVVEIVNNLFYDRFWQTWNLPKVARFFGEHVERLGADVVHFHHLMYLSAGCVEEAARHAPVAFTLHDYWLHCARFGQRVHADGTICHEIAAARCGDCLARTKWSQTPTEQRAGRVLAALRNSTGLDLGPAAVSSANLFLRRTPPGSLPSADPDATESMTAAVTERDRFMRERVVPHVDRFLAPSRFLRERFVEWGVAADRIDHWPLGVDLERFKPAEKTPSERVRVAFLGTLHPLKGAHVLLDAWARLGPERRAKGELVLYGPTRHNPAYVRSLRHRALALGVRVAGALKPDEVAEAFRSIDLLVVPSVWYENSPLAILEARATRTPALVSDLGGMAELVREGESGFHFRAGDADHLTERLGHLLEHPEELGSLSFESEPIRRVEEDIESLERLYADLAQARGDSSAARSD